MQVPILGRRLSKQLRSWPREPSIVPENYIPAITNTAETPSCRNIMARKQGLSETRILCRTVRIKERSLQISIAKEKTHATRRKLVDRDFRSLQISVAKGENSTNV